MDRQAKSKRPTNTDSNGLAAALSVSKLEQKPPSLSSLDISTGDQNKNFVAATRPNIQKQQPDVVDGASCFKCPSFIGRLGRSNIVETNKSTGTYIFSKQK